MRWARASLAEAKCAALMSCRGPLGQSRSQCWLRGMLAQRPSDWQQSKRFNLLNGIARQCLKHLMPTDLKDLTWSYKILYGMVSDTQAQRQERTPTRTGMSRSIQAHAEALMTLSSCHCARLQLAHVKRKHVRDARASQSCFWMCKQRSRALASLDFGIQISGPVISSALHAECMSAYFKHQAFVEILATARSQVRVHVTLNARPCRTLALPWVLSIATVQPRRPALSSTSPAVHSICEKRLEGSTTEWNDLEEYDTGKSWRNVCQRTECSSHEGCPSCTLRLVGGVFHGPKLLIL